MEPQSLKIVKEAYTELKETTLGGGAAMPINKDANRKLDCAVIQSIHESNRIAQAANPNDLIKSYDTVRSPFHEGGKIYEGSNFTDGLHIEIAVINVDMIIGYFLPYPTKSITHI